MKITNTQGLPAALVRAVTNDTYNNGGADFSITALISPPRILALKKKHAAEIVEDASDRIWSLVGSIGHAILQRGAQGSDIVEKRFFSLLRGKKLSGQFDYSPAPNDELYDWKFVSVWSIKE